MITKVICKECGIEFIDTYEIGNINKYNQRQWCNSCVNKRWLKEKKK